MDLNKIIKMNPLCRILIGEATKESLKVELLQEKITIDVKSLDFVKIANFVKDGKTVNEVLNFLISELNLSREESIYLINIYIDKKVLVDSNYVLNNAENIAHWIKRGWLEALYLHLNSRNIKYIDDNSLNRKDTLNKSFSQKSIENKKEIEIYKKVEGIKNILLPDATNLPHGSLEDTLLFRRSHQPFTNQVMSLQELSNILYYATYEGKRLREKVKNEYSENPSVMLNSAFSANEVYFFAFEVEDIESGLYFYDIHQHSIVLLKKGDYREVAKKICIGQKSAGEGKIAIMISAVWERYMHRYPHPRAYTNLIVNTGELAQKFLVLFSSYRKNCFMTPALNDSYADEILNLENTKEAILYVITAG